MRPVRALACRERIRSLGVTVRQPLMSGVISSQLRQDHIDKIRNQDSVVACCYGYPGTSFTGRSAALNCGELTVIPVSDFWKSALMI